MSSAVPSTLFQTDRRTSAARMRAPVVPPELLVSQPTIIAAALLYDAVAIFAVGAATFGVGRFGANSDEVVDGYFARDKVNPGITGWARSNGGAARPTRRKKSSGASRTTCFILKTGRWCLNCALTPLSLLATKNAY